MIYQKPSFLLMDLNLCAALFFEYHVFNTKHK